MFDTEVWCQKDYSKDFSPLEWKGKSVMAWKGKLPFIPREGEYIILHDGWCSEKVKSVYYDLNTQLVTVEIRPDLSGAYHEKAIELGFIKVKEKK